jgi:DNA-binding Xre family transcriptional regulator
MYSPPKEFLYSICNIELVLQIEVMIMETVKKEKLKAPLKIGLFDLNENLCVKIDENFMKNIFSMILSSKLPFYKIAKLLEIDESSLRELKKNPNKKIEIKTLKKILRFLRANRRDIIEKDVESKVIWIGNKCGRGITFPKLPFILNSPDFSTILSAVFGDGTITNISYSAPDKYKLGVFEYTNEVEILRKNLIDSCIKVFGGIYGKDYTERRNRNTVSVFFPSVIRDVILMVCNIRGEKSVLNPHVPEIIMNSDNKEVWINWLRQSFDDEGSVRYRNNSNHEIFLTRVSDITEFLEDSLKPGIRVMFSKLSKEKQEVVLSHPNNLLVDEMKLLERLGINGRIKPQEIYVTKSGRIKVKWRLYITRKENIRKFYQIIGFKTPKKQMILEKIIGGNNEL